jgi:hypothetical protein
MMDSGGGNVSIMAKALLISTPSRNLKAGLAGSDPGPEGLVVVVDDLLSLVGCIFVVPRKRKLVTYREP